MESLIEVRSLGTPFAPSLWGSPVGGWIRRRKVEISVIDSLKTLTTHGAARGLTLAQYAAATKLDVEFLASLGLTDTYFDTLQAVKIPYLDINHFTIATQFRTSMGGRAHFRKGDNPCPYGLGKLGEARADGYICLVKGHRDTQTLWKHGFHALGLPDADPWKKEDLPDYLKGIEKVYVVIYPEEGDEAVKQWLRNSKIRHRARLVTLHGAKDPSDLYLCDPAEFKHKWAAALESAPSWQKVERSGNSARGKELWVQCEELAKQPNILYRFEVALNRRSVIGEGRAKTDIPRTDEPLSPPSGVSNCERTSEWRQNLSR